MALEFYTRRDIDAISPDSIPERFTNYFDELPKEGKLEIVSVRPDLAKALNFHENDRYEDESYYDDDKAEDEYYNAIEDGLEAGLENLDSEKEDFAEIAVNIYAYIDEELLLDENERIEPVHALAIKNNPEKCPLHRTPLRVRHLIYLTKGKKGNKINSIKVYYCSSCKRFFIEESKVRGYSNTLDKLNINHKMFDLDLTNRYLRSQLKPIQLEDNPVYVPEVWIEENPKCPVHDTKLEELPYIKTYKDRKVEFVGYYCELCDKVLLRPALAAKIEDECYNIGIPIEIKTIVKEIRNKSIIRKDNKPDYIVFDGKRQKLNDRLRKKYGIGYNSEYYMLSETDTIVVSDSRYCNSDGHEGNDDVVASFMFEHKKSKGIASYIALVGWCNKCNKYYMDQMDYEAMNSYGRPKVRILNYILEDYPITSGHVFNHEKRHLANLEDDLNARTDYIKSQEDYQDRYSAGGYDDGGRNFAKTRSIEKYGQELKELNSYKDKPYSYRLDITHKGQTESYYLGARDLVLNNSIRVVSYNDPLWMEAINYRALEVPKDGKKYKIKLQRQFDIEQVTLFGYINIRTDEDSIYRKGITDPYLIKVLNRRKQQHNLVDIIATIQENQNKIIDTEWNKNIVVQGCAGSGKTMVLLHRLSYLQYNHKELDFNKALILTPNQQFNLHISGLVKDLQLDYIKRMSVEDYYLNLLIEYSNEFKPKGNKVYGETFLNQEYVNYIYSDDFLAKMKTAYKKVISRRNSLLKMLHDYEDSIEEERTKIEVENDSELVYKLEMVVDHYIVMTKQTMQEIRQALVKIDEIEDRKKFVEEKINEFKEYEEETIKDALPTIYRKIGDYVSSIKNNINGQNNLLNSINEEIEEVRSSVNIFTKKQKLGTLQRRYERAESAIKKEKQKISDIEKLFDSSMQDNSSEEILSWMEQMSTYVPRIREDIRSYEKAHYDYNNYLMEQISLEDDMLNAKSQYDKIISSKYLKGSRKELKFIKNKLNNYSVKNTYDIVFELSTKEFKKKHRIRDTRGVHRFDLYAGLWFSVWFYNSQKGVNKFICFDEGQDISINEYRLISQLNESDCIFNVFGDVNQLIKSGRGIKDWSNIIREFDAEKFVLNENYRNTNQITNYCNESFNMDVLQTGVDGSIVREIQRKDLEDELSNMDIGDLRVAIILSRRVKKGVYLDMDSVREDIKDIIGDQIGNGYISLMYVDEVKGIEFDKVCVLPNRMSRNERYIAYTRALSDLVIIVDESIK